MGSKFGSQRGAGLVNTRNAIRNLEPFKSNGALSGTNNPYTSHYMSPVEQDRFFAERNDIDYAVMSYDTPIAWHNKATGEWHETNTKHSVTTGRHQSVVRSALAGI